MSNFKIAVCLLGVVSLCSGGVLVRTRTVPIKSYGQQLAHSTPLKSVGLPVPAMPVHEELKPVELEVEEDEEAEIPMQQFKSAVRTPDRAPIRVSSYSKQPERDSYDSPQSQSARLENERLSHEQNKNAQYSFGSAIDDGINDMSQVRQETRDGLKVEGSYSYSDGFYKHTIKYVADEGGYRVLENLKEQIGDGSGPVTDPINGKADVHTSNQGVDMVYSVSAKELDDLKKTQLKAAASKPKSHVRAEEEEGY